ncbi:MAG: heparan-alpha-glucosaminide N-acetyltransferase, partial [Candidatus Aenigmatarchaeota archaeon]
MSSTEEWNRFWEIDLFRGLAVVGMVIFHFTFDLNFLGFVTLNLGPGLWFLLAFPIAFTFILLVGISMVISYDRRKDMMSKAEMHRKYLLRGLKILAYGMVITVFTRIFVPSAFVIFGILHFIGVSVILSYLLLLYNIDRRIYLVLAVFVSFIGSVLNSVSFETPWFLWLGLRPENFHTLDYFPLLPWFSVV